MTPTWVIQREVGSNGVYEAMLAHFDRREIPHHVIKIVPFSHEVIGDVPKLTGPVVCYGSTGMRKVARESGWAPGVWESELLGEVATRDALGELYLNADAERMRLSEVYDWWKSRGLQRRFFIKPDGELKIFSGSVMDGEDFAEWEVKLQNVNWFKNGDPLVVLSAPKTLGREWRVVVVGDKISEASLYLHYGRVIPNRGAPAAVADFVMRAHAVNAPAPVYVVDVVEVEDGYRVVERNTFNHSGLYACDVAKVVDDVTAFAAAPPSDAG